MAHKIVDFMAYSLLRNKGQQLLHKEEQGKATQAYVAEDDAMIHTYCTVSYIGMAASSRGELPILSVDRI
jgi:hypothetical protein